MNPSWLTRARLSHQAVYLKCLAWHRHQMTFADRILCYAASCCCLTDQIMIYQSWCNLKMGKKSWPVVKMLFNYEKFNYVKIVIAKIITQLIVCLMNCSRLCGAVNHWCDSNSQTVKRERKTSLFFTLIQLDHVLAFLPCCPVSLSHGFSEECVADCGRKHDLESVLLSTGLYIQCMRYLAVVIVHQNAHKGSNVVFSCPLLSARDRKPCWAHYSADCEWGVMPWIAGLFCCSRSWTSIPLEEKKNFLAIDLLKEIKGRVILQYLISFAKRAVLFCSVFKLRLVFHSAAAAQAQAEERRSLAGNSPGPATNAPAKPQGCKPGKRQRAPPQNLRCCTVTACTETNELNYRPRNLLPPNPLILFLNVLLHVVFM